jgi:hypothetical protein
VNQLVPTPACCGSSFFAVPCLSGMLVNVRSFASLEGARARPAASWGAASAAGLFKALLYAPGGLRYAVPDGPCRLGIVLDDQHGLTRGYSVEKIKQLVLAIAPSARSKAIAPIHRARQAQRSRWRFQTTSPWKNVRKCRRIGSAYPPGAEGALKPSG